MTPLEIRHLLGQLRQMLAQLQIAYERSRALLYDVLDSTRIGRELGATIPERGAGGQTLKRDENGEIVVSRYSPELLQAACEKARIPLTLRRQPGYDHSYYFISTFMPDHLRWHAER